MRILTYVAGTLALVVVFMGLGILVVELDARAGALEKQRKDFEAVCTYLGGDRQGDVCIKGNEVVLKKKDIK
jgi:hypothetical protein